MRLDVLTIFPDYLAPLGLSLIGKARDRGLLDLRVHDLREVTTDRHRTVDDTPFGGGAGMVMKPEPWALALERLVDPADGGAAGARPRLLVPAPSGRPFTQAMAHELAGEPWLAFACGRYEGIDERVLEFAREDLGLVVDPISLGDYVLNGGEVAALAVTEAVVRLLPGVVGNAESLVEESHEDGLLEYPVYTKPSSWRGRDVPPVLLSGDHGAIADWRHQQRLSRTAARRPDLLHASATTGSLAELDHVAATAADAPELMVLTRACWAAEFARHGMFGAGEETVQDVVDALGQWQTHLFRSSGRLVASVRARRDPDDPGTWQIGRLMVAPDLQGRGLGRSLLAYAEQLAPGGTARVWLNTGATSERNLRIYRRAGYRVLPGEGAHPGTVDLAKRVGPVRAAGTT